MLGGNTQKVDHIGNRRIEPTVFNLDSGDRPAGASVALGTDLARVLFP